MKHEVSSLFLTAAALQLGIVVWFSNLIPVASEKATKDAPGAAVEKQSVEKFLDSEKELLLMLYSDSKLEEYLLLGPAVGVTLAQLVILSSNQHFRLRHALGARFKYLRYNYLQPAVVQITNEGWKAFLTADEHMALLKATMGEIQRYVKKALMYLGSTKPEVIARFLPIPLNSINKSMDECIQYAQKAYLGFKDIVQMISELREALTTTDAHTREHFPNVTQETLTAKQEERLPKSSIETGRWRTVGEKSTKEQEKFVRTIKDKVKLEFSKVSKQFEEDRTNYARVLKNVPAGWNAAFQDMVRGISPMEIAGTLMGSFGPLSEFWHLGRVAGVVIDSLKHGYQRTPNEVIEQLISKLGKQYGDIVRGVADRKFTKLAARETRGNSLLSQYNIDQAHALNAAKSAFYGVSEMTHQIKDFLRNTADKGPGDIAVKKQKESLANYLVAKREGSVVLTQILMKKGESPWKEASRRLLQQFTNCTGRLISTLSKSDTLGHKLQEEIRQDLMDLSSIQKMCKFLVSVQAFRNGGISSREPAPRRTPSGSLKWPADIERFIAVLSQSTLYEVQQRYDKYFESLTVVADKQLLAVSKRSSLLKVGKIDRTKIQEHLGEVIRGVSGLKKLFERLIHLVVIFSGVTSEMLKATTNFVSTAKKMSHSSKTMQQFANDDAISVVRESLRATILKVGTVSKFIHTLTDAYGLISRKYIIRRIATASGLQAVPESGKDAKMQELLNEIKLAHKAIMMPAKQKRTQFKLHMAKSRNKTKEIFDAFGPSPDGDNKMIHSAKVVVDVQIVTELKHM